MASKPAERQGKNPPSRVGYRDIIDYLLREIQNERWSVGDVIASEAELVNRFGTTRTTVRQALKEIETLGYIKRRRGARSLLVSTDPSDDFLNSVRSIEEMLQYSQRTSSRLLGISHIEADEALASRLGVKAGSRWLRVEFLRNPPRGKLPLGYSDIYVADRYADIAGLIEDNKTVFSLIQQEHDAVISRVEQEIQAAAVPERAADLLKVRPGSPVMVVRTRFITGPGDVAEVGFGHFPAGRFRLEMVLERSSGERLE